MDTLIHRVNAFGSPRVAVVGDFMLDRYVYGDADRISPEVPVPVFKTVRGEARTGGAGNVAMAVLALGGQVSCCGVTGEDAEAGELLGLLTAAGADTEALIAAGDRPTTVKTRYVGLARHRHAQQMLRVDRESASPIDPATQQALRGALSRLLGRVDVVALEDYDKGVLNDANTPQLIADARAAGKMVVVDPANISDYRRYRGCTVLKPNRFEAWRASGVSITNDASLAQSARRILEITSAAAVVVTLDKEGSYVMPAGGEGLRVPTRPRSVFDVTGAGDVVLAMLAVALAEGCDFQQSAVLANVIGGLEVERFGTVPITRREVLEELYRCAGPRGGKLMERAELAQEVARRRAGGQRIVFTNGCFDLLHVGHVRYLQQARQLGDCLVLAINSDDSVRRLKGAARPVIVQRDRAEMLAALECVDLVTVFEEDTPCQLLELLRPDVLAKGGTTQVIVGREIVEAYGGRAVRLDEVPGLSTTNIIQRIAAAPAEAGN